MRKMIAGAIVAASLVVGVAAVASPPPNNDPGLASIASQLRCLADQVDVSGNAANCGPATPTTTVAPDTSTSVPVTTVPTTAPVTTTSQPPTSTTVVTQGVRDLKQQPFAASSPWNTPRGADATFDSRSVISTGGVNINTIAYGVSVYGAGYSSPAQLGLELATSTIQPDGVTAYETTAFLPNGVHTITDLRGTGYNVTVNGNSGQYLRATKMSLLAGLLRLTELQAAANGDVHAIKHPIALGLSSKVLNKSFVWPAFAEDSFAGSNTGYMPEGGFMAIPSNTTAPAGLNNVGKAIWQALRDYGAYAVDASGQGGTLTVVEMEAAADGIATTVRGQIGSIMGQVRYVTNSSQSLVGGPGARLAPYPANP